MRSVPRLLTACALLMLVGSPASAQLVSAKFAPVAYGHHHLRTADVAAQKRFWVDTLGGVVSRVGTLEMIKFLNVHVMLMAQPSTGGTKGTTVNHIGFQVPNLREVVDTIRAAGFPVITRAEVPASIPVDSDLAFIADQNTYVAFVMAPDDVKVEFVENRKSGVAVANHHVHFNTPQVAEMQAWYAKVFGATIGKRGSFDAADLPGVNLTFSPATSPVVATRERALDHIGFEVDDLEGFCKKLEGLGITLDRPLTDLPHFGLKVAFLTDPWGTYIELTEGLDEH